MLNRIQRILLDPKGAEGSIVDRLYARIQAGLPLPSVSGGDGSGDGNQNTPPAGGQGGGNGNEPDLAKTVQDLITKHGDENKAMKILLKENHQLRAKNSKLKGNTVPEGAKVLQGDDAKAWDAYVALGLPDALKTSLEDGTKALNELGGLRKAELHRTVAESLGFKEAVLTTLIEKDQLQLEVKEETDKGKTVKVAYAKGVDPKAPEALTKLSDYAQSKWSDFLPSLKAETSPARPVLGTPKASRAFDAGSQTEVRPAPMRRTAGI
ncbi:hypothetical protein [Singulisphaera sp. PoT]|uniref:hypothetical protein n=1 Tax=Singulisphaera sp. PoT TaxID=3411797 RepID=UPI003BF4A287